MDKEILDKYNELQNRLKEKHAAWDELHDYLYQYVDLNNFVGKYLKMTVDRHEGKDFYYFYGYEVKKGYLLGDELSIYTYNNGLQSFDLELGSRVYKSDILDYIEVTEAEYIDAYNKCINVIKNTIGVH